MIFGPFGVFVKDLKGLFVMMFYCFLGFSMANPRLSCLGSLLKSSDVCCGLLQAG